MNETIEHLKNQLAEKTIQLNRANSEVSFLTKRQCEVYKEVFDLNYRLTQELKKVFKESDK